MTDNMRSRVLGMILGSVSKGQFPQREPVAFFYGHVAKEGETPTHPINGVGYVGWIGPKLPDTDLLYSLIHKSLASNIYYFVASEKAGEAYNTATSAGARIEIAAEATHRWEVWELIEDTAEWVESFSSDDRNFHNIKATGLIWVNYDIYHKDSRTVPEELRGTLYASADPDPVPIYE